MLEIKIETKPAIPARPQSSRHELWLDGYEVTWDGPPEVRSIHCFPPRWTDHDRVLTSADFRKFASIFNEIADALEATAGADDSTAKGLPPSHPSATSAPSPLEKE